MAEISPQRRRLVATRANFCCEYCLIHDDDTFLGCQVDHIVSRKHGGADDDGNLAFACAFCNRHKGSDLGSLTVGGELIRFFNPRTERWVDHFRLVGALIEPLTNTGEVTARILEFNSHDQMAERALLIRQRRYPPRRI